MVRKAGIKKQRISHDVDAGIRQIRIALNDRVRHEIDQLSDEWVRRLDQKKLESSEELQVSLEADAEALFIRIHLDAAASIDRLLTEQLQSIPTFEDAAADGPDLFSGDQNPCPSEDSVRQRAREAGNTDHWCRWWTDDRKDGTRNRRPSARPGLSLRCAVGARARIRCQPRLQPPPLSTDDQTTTTIVDAN